MGHVGTSWFWKCRMTIAATVDDLLWIGSGDMRLHESTGMEMMCFDGKGWLAPTRGHREWEDAKHRLRLDINQMSLEMLQRAHTEIHSFFFFFFFPGVCHCLSTWATRLVTSKVKTEALHKWLQQKNSNYDERHEQDRKKHEMIAGCWGSIEVAVHCRVALASSKFNCTNFHFLTHCWEFSCIVMHHSVKSHSKKGLLFNFQFNVWNAKWCTSFKSALQ